ncbi:uncharacterized protein LOC131144672 isoform X1 [Malania oleifera]|uniref:uncharacterized protein LOC131144672 isoform X1 n=1 Tax=Malania oleifera TaxID=397392 RepID=UPI0025AE6B89|nr:uncharacterized protein LOC131144672 isoform X1 [Malania oleifera]XP_057949436.1 uncharacterized protein LOC131144672 isoform X1 [Malania oleifera]
MSLLTMNCWWSTNTEPSIFSRKFISLCDVPNILATKLCNKLGTNTRAFSSRNSVKKLRRDGQHKNETFPTTRRPSDKYNGQAEGFSSEDDNVRDNDRVSFSESSAAQSSNTVSSSRSTVLKACTNTSGFIAALGVTIRQVCHFASKEGWPILDCSTEISFEFEMWHLQLIAGLVLMVSSCRYLLLKTWPDFAESSEAANRQVLSSLEPLDYILVAVLPGVSEELLFRGALLPLFGANWISVLGVAAIFGSLHLGGGRKFSFTIWATFVGFAYGYATIISSSVIVPMASHAVNNLMGGLLWRYTSNSSK